jgi:hypothetical protein
VRCFAWWFGLVGLVASTRASAQTVPAAEAEAEKRERATLLAQALPDAVALRSRSAVVPLIGALGLGLTFIGSKADWELTALGGAVTAAGAVAFYLTPETRNYELVATTTSVGIGLLYLGMESESLRRWQQPIGAAYLTQSVLFALNTVYSPHPGRTQLVRDLRRVRTPAGRHGLSQQELYDIERHLYRTDPFVPRWLMGLPLVVGGLLASLPVLDGDASPTAKVTAGVMAGSTVVNGLALSFAPSPADQYRDAQRRAGLWLTWAPGPGGVSLVGTFD